MTYGGSMMYRQPEQEEYQDDWLEAERDLAINYFTFWTWFRSDFPNILTPFDELDHTEQLDKTVKKGSPTPK